MCASSISTFPSTSSATSSTTRSTRNSRFRQSWPTPCASTSADSAAGATTPPLALRKHAGGTIVTTAPTQGVEGILVETHNWGKTVAFWQALGYVLEFETDHHSGQLRHPAGGPYLFIEEVPSDRPVGLAPMLGLDSVEGFAAPESG